MGFLEFAEASRRVGGRQSEQFACRPRCLPPRQDTCIGPGLAGAIRLRTPPSLGKRAASQRTLDAAGLAVNAVLRIDLQGQPMWRAPQAALM
jgi:hypothetical protein